MVPTRLSDGQRPTLDVSQLPDTPDPLTLALQPPPDETPVEKGARIVAELAAKKVSDNIDAAIRVEKAALRKLRQNEVRVLLLGQSESGKSTCIKQFQILYSPNAFAAERANWRAVIYLNLIRTVRRILDVVSPPISPSMFPPEPPEPELDPKTLELVNDSDKRSVTSQNSSSDQLLAPHATKFRELQLRLKPLKLVEDLLVSKLAVGPESEGEATELGDWKVGGGGAKEYFVNASSWMRSMGKMKSMGDIKQRNSDDSGSASGSGSGTSASGARANGSRENLRSDDPFRLIEACRQDMINLWRDPAVQKILHAKKIRLEESAGLCVLLHFVYSGLTWRRLQTAS
jgi:energy-coupling factor transporter ATP-binding protein EcfA2